MRAAGFGNEQRSSSDHDCCRKPHRIGSDSCLLILSGNSCSFCSGSWYPHQRPTVENSVVLIDSVHCNVRVSSVPPHGLREKRTQRANRHHASDRNRSASIFGLKGLYVTFVAEFSSMDPAGVLLGVHFTRFNHVSPESF